MDKFIRFFFSMRMMTLGMLIFLVAIGTATILESIYDIQTAKIFIYNALWFELLLTFLGVNLIANIFTFRMYQKEKVASLMFHVSFIVILIGAAVTRFVSFEGLMLIREGESSDIIYQNDPHLWYRVNDGKMQYINSHKMFMSEVANNHFSLDFEFPNHKTEIDIEYVDFKKKHIDSLVVNDSINGIALDIVVNGQSNYLTEGNFLMLGEVALSFGKKDAMPGVEFFRKGLKLMMKTQLPMRYLPMAEMRKVREQGLEVKDSMYIDVPMDSLVSFQTTTLYMVGGQQFVLKNVISNAKMIKMPSGRKDVGSDYLTIKVSDGSEFKIIELEGGISQIPTTAVFILNGLTYEMQYGSTPLKMPFYVVCRDFQLDRYPGSNSPSSFASELTIVDEKKNFTKDYRVFMNNVIDYDGYRFFQSSYDEDEKGTRLSVNHDWWGTNITYLGYLMMAVGMIMSLFARNGRMRELNEQLKKSRVKREKLLSVLFVLLLLPGNSWTQTHDHSDHEGHDHRHEEAATPQSGKPVFRVMSKEHADNVSTLLVQDFQGRIIPFHTLCDQLLRKLSRKNTYKEYNAIQTVMSMHMYPDYWLDQDFIYVSKNLREQLNVKNEMTSIKELMDEHGDFILEEEYEKAHHKLESRRNEFDKNLIKLVDRFQVAQSIFMWSYMKIIPLESDPGNAWYLPLNMELMQRDSTSSRLALRYLTSLDKAMETSKYGEVDDILEELKAFQFEEGKNVVPSKNKVKIEVAYNKMNIIKNALNAYLILGLLLLVVFFIRIFMHLNEKRNRYFKILTRICIALMVLTFTYHGLGLGFRWFISGHAPWSNGYEAVVFIAWVSVIAGFIFSRKNPVILAGTAILAALMLFVTEMNLLDPEISPLVPVLKSYWLMIHVAIITGSYGFLGLACILGLLNMFMFIFRNQKNGKVVTLNILELTHVSEMTMIVGLFMLTIGTFLGGIWANESWGRYWGWDPKETWALVSVLVYATILHFRFIPKLKGKFTFNVASVWGYSAILFTFFGVNFYLVGLHSYANGEGLAEIPTSLYIAVLSFLAFTILAYIRYRSYERSNKIVS